jgi:hypothetical protein
MSSALTPNNGHWFGRPKNIAQIHCYGIFDVRFAAHAAFFNADELVFVS